MKILAVDTALGACSAAVLDGEIILAHQFEAMDRGHAEALAPMVESVVRRSSLGFAELDRLAVTTGPGTFTGQRVGIAFMRGLRVALRCPLIGITTLEALCAAALEKSETRYAAAIHDAKRGEVYLAIMLLREMLLPPTLVPLNEVAGRILQVTGVDAPVALTGTAAEFVGGEMGARAIVTQVQQPDALWVARRALHTSDISVVPKPLYLREPDAKLPAAKL